jgi:hypothetical protein
METMTLNLLYIYNAIVCLIKDFILAHLYMETMILQGIWVTGISIAMCPLLHHLAIPATLW